MQGALNYIILKPGRTWHKNRRVCRGQQGKWREPGSLDTLLSLRVDFRATRLHWPLYQKESAFLIMKPLWGFCCSVTSHVQLFVTSWTAACQASLSFTISWSLLKLMFPESVMPSNYVILCHPLLLLPSIFPSIRVFSSELALRIRWPKNWNFSFSISQPSEYSGLISLGLTGLILLSKEIWRAFSSITIQKHHFFGAWSSLWE